MHKKTKSILVALLLGAIAAPLIMLIAVRGVLSLRGPWMAALAILFIGAAGLSSFLALRQDNLAAHGAFDLLARQQVFDAFPYRLLRQLGSE